MYSGLLPKGLSEAAVSSGEEEEHSGTEALSTGHEQEQRPLSYTVSTAQPEFLTQSSLHREHSGQKESPTEDCLPGVPLKLWQKFKELKQERETWNLNRPHRKKRRKTRHRKDGGQEQDGDTEEKRERKEEHWEELTQYFGSNDRFQPPACSRPPLKSGLEKSMERAIAEGDFGKAEELSDRLATRELAVKIAQAVDCRDFTLAKRDEEASRDARKRRKQVAWGFEAKKRWETKSNMGFM